MKKSILIALACCLGLGSFAHKATNKHAVQQLRSTKTYGYSNHSDLRTTGLGDTLVLSNVVTGDTPTLYLAGGLDSGYVSGTDVYEDMGFAERYDFNSADSSLKVLGVVALFGGKYKPTSTKTVTFYTWSVGPRDSTNMPYILSGLPNYALDSVNVSITHLGIGASDTVSDTFKSFMFTTPTNFLFGSFFVGYTINYSYGSLAGDTIGVYTTRDGHRASADYIPLGGGDTLVNDQNATLYGDGTGWHDNVWDNFFMDIDYYMFPIVKVGAPNSVKGITKNNFTFFGNYPNPSVNNTNIKFSLSMPADVIVTVTDQSGKVVKTIKENGLTTGMHLLNVVTSDLAAGNYVYIVRTSSGDGIASQLSVIK